MLHADICTQGLLLQNADVIIMNNVFEYFLNETEQARYVIYLFIYFGMARLIGPSFPYHRLNLGPWSDTKHFRNDLNSQDIVLLRMNSYFLSGYVICSL